MRPRFGACAALSRAAPFRKGAIDGLESSKKRGREGVEV